MALGNVKAISSRKSSVGSVKSAVRPPKNISKIQAFGSVTAAIEALRPALPMHCWQPDNIAANAKAFVEGFKGESFYAVKSNPDLYLLKGLFNNGIRSFDVASIGEIRLIAENFPSARMAFMHPVKSRESIRAAYFRYDVRIFVLDTEAELIKILEETNFAKDLTLIVRLARPAGAAACPLANKFGATYEEAVRLLLAVEQVAEKTGVSFHVGSQMLEPQAYCQAVQMGKKIFSETRIVPDIVDVGGGFPVAGLGMDVPPLADFFAAIHAAVAELGLPPETEIWAEPGRALSATSEILVVRVEARKGDLLYLNDGFFGSMSEIRMAGWQNQCSLVGRALAANVELSPFKFYGATCDSVDFMPGPFLLPADIREGDYIAIQSTGAYTTASQSRFNGFYSDLQVEIIP